MSTHQHAATVLVLITFRLVCPSYLSMLDNPVHFQRHLAKKTKSALYRPKPAKDSDTQHKRAIDCYRRVNTILHQLHAATGQHHKLLLAVALNDQQAAPLHLRVVLQRLHRTHSVSRIPKQVLQSLLQKY